MRLLFGGLVAIVLTSAATAQDELNREQLVAPQAVTGFPYGRDRANRVRVTDYRPGKNLSVVIFVPAHPGRGENRASSTIGPRTSR